MATRIWRLILVCLPALAAPLGAQQAADHIAMGIDANLAHDPGTAVQHFEAALEQDSSSYEANWRAALALLDLGEQAAEAGSDRVRDSLYREAERYAGRAVSADSGRAEGHFALAAAVGRGSLNLGRKSRIRRAAIVRREALRTIEIDPRHDGAYHVLGRWNAELMRISGFSRFFARNFLGAGILGKASWGRAIGNLEKAVELDPGRIYHRLELARIYAHRKRNADAEAQLRTVDSLPVRELMDSVYKERGAELSRRLTRR